MGGTEPHVLLGKLTDCFNRASGPGADTCMVKVNNGWIETKLLFKTDGTHKRLS
jgi:hypothetical protein